MKNYSERLGRCPSGQMVAFVKYVSLSLMALFLAGAAEAATKTVAAGETLQFAQNKYDTYQCLAGSTLQFAANYPTASCGEVAKCAVFDGTIIATNGTFTLDLSQLPESVTSVALTHVTRGGMTPETPFVVKGRRKLYFGVSSGSSAYPEFNVTNLQFQTSDGTEIANNELTSGEGLVFADRALVRFVPSYPYSLATGAEIQLYGVKPSDFGYFTTNANNEIVLQNYSLNVIQTNVFDWGATFRVKPGRRLTHRPLVPQANGNWNGSDDVDLSNDIILESTATQRAGLYNYASKRCFFTGSVTGVGDFIYNAQNYGNPGCGFVGPLDFYGTMTIHGNSTASVLGFNIASDSPGSPTNTLVVGGWTRTVFAKPETARYAALPCTTPTAVTIGTLKGESPTASNTNIAEVAAVAGQTVTIKNMASGPVRLVGEGTFVLDRVEAAATVLVTPSVTVRLGTVVSGATIVYVRTQPHEYFKLLDDDGHLAHLEPNAGVFAVTNAFLEGVRLIDANYRVRASDGFAYRLQADGWKQKLALWVDPTASDRLERLNWSNENPHVSNKYYCYELAHDKREDQTYLLQNNYQRAASGDQGNNWHKSTSPYPFLVTDSGPVVGGVRLPYFSMGTYQSGSSRRFYVGKEGSSPYKAEKLPAKFVVMVFGGQNGGGMALVKDGNSEACNVFARCETTETPTCDMPIFTNTAFRTWLDGVEVDPTTTKLKSGWQVVSFRTDGNDIAGFGYTQITHKNGGGQCYGDILLFTEELTESEREDVESALAAKWGLAYTKSVVTTSVGGAGSLTVAADVAMCPQGYFGGTLTVEKGATVVLNASLPPTETDVAKISGRVNWFDPDQDDTVVNTGSAANPDAVRVLLDRVDGNAEGHYCLYGTGDREPFAVRGAHTFGAPERTWLDFTRHLIAENPLKGNTLRYRPTPYTREGNNNASPNYSNNVKTVCMVFEASRIETPVLDAISPTSKDLVQTRKALTDPIWAAGTSTILTGGAQYLDGVAVQGTTIPFDTRATVFSFTTDGRDFPLLCVGYHNSDSGNLANSGGQFGEMLFFDRVLEANERKTVENYLASKWLGAIYGNYTDVRTATVTGAGTVRAASFAVLPQFAAGFTGAVDVTADEPTVSFAIAGSTVQNAYSFGDGTLTFSGASSVSVSVAFTARASAAVRTFKLISWSDGKGPAATFALANGQPTGAHGTGTYTLRKASDGLYLDYQPYGLSIFFR